MSVKTQKDYWISVLPRSLGTELHKAIGDMTVMVEAKTRIEKVVLYAGALSFVTPSEVCGLRAVLAVAAQAADLVLFECPLSPLVHRYLERMNFYADLPHNVELSQEVTGGFRHDRGDSLIELTSVYEESQAAELVDRVMRVAKDDFGSASILQAFCVAVSEALGNAAEHANSPIGALVSAQRYETSRLELMVVDTGQGIRRSLARNPLYAALSDADALEMALEDGVSGVNAEGRGAGLPDLIRRARSVPWSQVVIRSGHAQISIEQANGLRSTDIERLDVGVVGTWIYVRLENFSDN